MADSAGRHTRVLAGEELLGILGALLAIPVAEIIRILGAEWFASRAKQTGGTVHGAESQTSLKEVAADAAGREDPRRGD